MAEGGGTTFGNPAFDPGDYDIDPDEDIDPNNYDVSDQEGLSGTQPFQPGQASTPNHGGEQIEMQTTQHEQSGGRPSYEETSFGGNDRTPLLSATDSNIEEALFNLKRGEGPGINEIIKRDKFTGAINQNKTPKSNPGVLPHEIRNDIYEKAKRFILSRFPNARLDSLQFGFDGNNPLELVVLGPGEKATYKVFLKDGSDFQKSFLDKKFVKKALGEPAASKILQTSAEIRKLQKQREKLRREQQLYFKSKEAKEKEELDLKRRIQAEEEKQQQLQDDPDADKKLLKEKDGLIKNLKKDLKTKQKENAQLKKNYEDSQKKTQEIGRLNTTISQEEQKRDSLERRLNSTRSFDVLKEQESNLLRQNEDDQAIINDDGAAEMDKEAAEERIAARNEELARLQTQIVEREEAMPLREKIKEIFKKHGVTVAAIFIAAGVTIGAVVSSITKGLKATGKAMAGGLKELAAKLGSLLPGLIGQVVSFLFNTAAKAVGFLAEHTWLMILAVVAFLFEKYIKKRR